jgi:hypothetical protein
MGNCRFFLHFLTSTKPLIPGICHPRKQYQNCFFSNPNGVKSVIVYCYPRNFFFSRNNIYGFKRPRLNIKPKYFILSIIVSTSVLKYQIKVPNYIFCNVYLLILWYPTPFTVFYKITLLPCFVLGFVSMCTIRNLVGCVASSSSF